MLLWSLRKKLRFLRGNYYLAAAWPVATIIVGAVGWHVLLSGLQADREARERQAFRDVEVLARSYSDQLTRAVAEIDQIALQIRYHWEMSKGQFQLDDAKTKAAFTPVSLLYQVGILNQNGVLSTGTLPAPNGAYLGNNAYFLEQKTATKDLLYIGEPTEIRVANGTSIPFSRRLLNPDGSFGGVVAISVAPSYFTGSYNQTTFGKYGLLGIIGNDNIMRAMRIGQSTDRAGTESFVSSLRFPELARSSTLLDGTRWFSDKRSRFVGWNAVAGYPILAMAGLDQEEVLESYRASRVASVRDAILDTCALAMFTFIAITLSMRLAWRKHQLETTQAAYRTATEGGREGFYIARPIYGAGKAIVDFKVIDCNHRGAELFLQRREELIGKTISTLFSGAKPDRIIGMLCRSMKAESYEGELDVPGESPFVARWAHLKIVRVGGTLAVTLRDVSDAKAHVAELERLINEDALTGLPNRHWVQNHLPKAIEEAAAKDTMLAVLFIDLDGFKAVNDAMGHAAGDEVLRNSARRLQVAVRPHDSVVRLGGDEFVVVLEYIENKSDAAHVAERILHSFQDGFRLADGVHAVGASVGISVFPSDGTNANTLLHHADIAMYSVKTTGKRNYRFFDEKFYEALRARLENETELRHAIQLDQLVMYYQPRIDMSTGATSSMEALVRWAHPLKGLLEPLEFIPLAEETGLILSLGELVIDKVCAQMACWEQSGQELVPVSINVSCRQFNEGDVANVFSTCMARHNIDPKLIEIELTESSMMGDSRSVANALTGIQKMGIKLLVDDFGTGYSSLSQLQRLDFDVLKVDRAFTAELGKSEEGNVLFTAIITMAHALGMRVVAEGVETLAQIQILKLLQCDEIQGFYISKPLPPSEMQPILPRWLFPWVA